ncbi:MAG: TRAP transporter substrate-binding protein [Candidatus Eremiobacteraeota bacterium]|nr:TRAP transporter substrate-binding protein [Candidatus Eremiobacteraeota bacterium]
MKERVHVSRGAFVASAAAATAITSFPAFVRAAETRKLSFGYDQPHDTIYGFTGDTFGGKLRDLSNGTLILEQYPGAQLGQEPEMAQKVRSGDMDICINSTANSAAISPQAGVFSLEYLYPNEETCVKSVLDPAVNDTYKKMIRETVTGAFSLGLMTWGLRDMYAKFEIHNINDVKGKKVRVQATKTEDAFMTAYGAVPVHMPFGQVYTSLQTGVVQIAENSSDVYLKNKHYEVAPVLSLTGHEANNYNILVSMKTWNSFNKDQQKWIVEAFNYTQPLGPRKAVGNNHTANDTLRKLGIKVVDNVDKGGFISIARPVIEQQAKELGPYAEQLLKQVRALER